MEEYICRSEGTTYMITSYVIQSKRFHLDRNGSWQYVGREQFKELLDNDK